VVPFQIELYFVSAAKYHCLVFTGEVVERMITLPTSEDLIPACTNLRHPTTLKWFLHPRGVR
jgi:hypothetical protein